MLLLERELLWGQWRWKRTWQNTPVLKRVGVINVLLRIFKNMKINKMCARVKEQQEKESKHSVRAQMLYCFKTDVQETHYWTVLIFLNYFFCFLVDTAISVLCLFWAMGCQIKNYIHICFCYYIQIYLYSLETDKYLVI